MRTCLVACSMIENELKAFIPPDLEVIWLDRGLHEWPQKLRAELQNTLDNLSKDVDTVLLGFGFCGTALDGIRCETAHLVLPLYDDCIEMMLCEARDVHSMYYTEGWLEESKIPGSVFGFEMAIEKYGEKKARALYKTLLKGYTHLCLLDTGVYDVEAAYKRMKAQAEKLALLPRKEKGDILVFKELFQSSWDEGKFWVLAKGDAFTLEGFLQRKKK